MPLTPGLERERLMNLCEPEINMVYTASSKQLGLYNETMSKKNYTNKRGRRHGSAVKSQVLREHTVLVEDQVQFPAPMSSSYNSPPPRGSDISIVQ